jgi:hypothetical protein
LTLRVQDLWHPEGTVPIPEKDINSVIASIANGDVHFAVFVEVAFHDCGGDIAGGERGPKGETNLDRAGDALEKRLTLRNVREILLGLIFS